MTREFQPPLHPIDESWIRNRFAGGPLILGAIGVLTSPLVIGVLFGALGLQGGLTLWRRGLRRPIVAIGLGASAVAVLVGVASALLWASLVASVLLGRSAMQEAEGWRGRALATSSIVADSPDGPIEVGFPAGPRVARVALLFLRVELPLSVEALRAVRSSVQRHPDCALIVVDTEAELDRLRAFVARTGSQLPLIGAGGSVPAPLGSVAAVPTLVVVGRDGRIESALIGIRPPEELEKVLGGAAALPSAEGSDSRAH